MKKVEVEEAGQLFDQQEKDPVQNTKDKNN
jgi:hypothetical protein